MHKYLIRAAAAVCAILFFSLRPAAAMPDIMGTDEIYPGMSGKVYTVVDYTGEIREFDAAIIGVVDNGRGEAKQIMALAEGPVVEAAGGVLQGMSGSPVYVDGRLIGALSAGMRELDPYKFFITPIGDMLELWNLPDRKNQTHLHMVDIRKMAALRDKLAAREEKKQMKKKAEALQKAMLLPGEHIEKAEAEKKPAETEKKAEDAAAKAEETAASADTEKNQTDAAAKAEKKEAEPAADSAKKADAEAAETAAAQEPKDLLYMSGFGTAAQNFMQKKMSGMGMAAFLDAPVAFGAAADYTTDYDAELQPGGNVGTALVYGDFFMGSMGTVTAVDGKRILAFGHPFLHRGNVNYFMTTADVVGTIGGMVSGTKVIKPGRIIGRINQDRTAGLAGELGVFPSVVPMRVNVRDHSLSRDNAYFVRIAYDEDFLPVLTQGVAYAALEKTSDSMGESTAKVHFSIQTNAVPSGKVERSNMFYGLADVGQTAVTEIAQAMDLICSNTDRESDIVDVNVDIDIEGGRKTASILSAVPDKTKVYPGETVTFKTTIKPYRREKETVMIPFKVPERQREGTMRIDVHGGGLMPAAQLFLLQQAAAAGVDMNADEDKSVKTEDKLKDFMDQDMNNDIVVEPGSVMLTEAEQKKAMKEAARAAEQSKAEAESGAHEKKRESGREAQPIKAKVASNYIIDNVVHATLQVLKKE